MILYFDKYQIYVMSHPQHFLGQQIIYQDKMQQKQL
jgi:hypothetical protein